MSPPTPVTSAFSPPNAVQGGAHGDLCAPPTPYPVPPRPTRSALSPAACPRAPSLRGRPERGHSRARARLPRTAEKARGRVRRGEAGGGQRRSGAMQLASHTRPPAPLTRAHSREERTLARVPHRHSPKETEGRTETRRTRLRQSRATVAQPRTATPGTARRDFLTHSRSSPREPQQAREENAHCAPAAII